MIESALNTAGTAGEIRNAGVIPFPVCGVTVILASKSPRRIELMTRAGIRFTVRLAGETEETYPVGLQREEIPLYLARLKANAFLKAIAIPDGTVVVTADTIVQIGDRTLGKPAGREEAIDMLGMLSASMHRVYTGVCLTANDRQHAFYDESRVFFRKLTGDEITFYVDNFHPYDKAGSYGIQEWVGCVGIERIEGSYDNVMGLPMQKLYCELRNFIG